MNAGGSVTFHSVLKMLRLSLGLLISAVLALPAFADDWAVTKLRGTAEAMAGEAWVALKRGEVVSDDRLIRTLADSRIELQRRLYGDRTAELVRTGLLAGYAVQLARDAAKWLVGHKRPLRARRMRLYANVLRNGLRSRPEPQP